MASIYEWTIGTRYLRSTHRRGFVSFVALAAIVGLMLGVGVLIVVLSVMNGFERELRSRILAATSHATIAALDGALVDWKTVQEAAAAVPGVLVAAPYIEEQSLLSKGERISGTMIRGVDPRDEVRIAGLAQRMTSGSIDTLRAGEFAIVLGSALAAELDAGIGDRLVAIAPEGTATPSGIMPRMRSFRVSGIFNSGMYEFDRSLALINLADAARLYHLGGAMTGIRLTLADALRAPTVVRNLALSLGGGFYISDWTRNHANFFRSIETTKTMMFVILLMIVGVATFNIVATLVMIVKDKQGDIAILRTLGAAPRNILALFGIQGVLIGLVGTALGAALGIAVAHNVRDLVRALERLLGTHFLDASVYYMSELPAYVEWRDVVQVSAVAFMLCALATIYPAWRASRTAPAEVLRHD